MMIPVVKFSGTFYEIPLARQNFPQGIHPKELEEKALEIITEQVPMLKTLYPLKSLHVFIKCFGLKQGFTVYSPDKPDSFGRISREFCDQQELPEGIDTRFLREEPRLLERMKKQGGPSPREDSELFHAIKNFLEYLKKETERLGHKVFRVLHSQQLEEHNGQTFESSTIMSDGPGQSAAVVSIYGADEKYNLFDIPEVDYAFGRQIQEWWPTEVVSYLPLEQAHQSWEEQIEHCRRLQKPTSERGDE